MSASPPTAVLVHSPFLGPASLRPLADALGARGCPALRLDLRVTVNAAPVTQRLIGVFADAVEDSLVEGPLVLVGHSGAGPLLPGLADTLERDVTGLVFLDSALPTPGRAWRDTAPPELVAHLKKISSDGRLPRWDRWFDTDPMTELVADRALREEIVDEAPEVPLAFLKEARPSAAWSGHSGYVQLSDHYSGDAAEAERAGYRVERLAGDHLWAATHPAEVADALLRVLPAG
jgi:hypothetical protein